MIELVLGGTDLPISIWLFFLLVQKLLNFENKIDMGIYEWELKFDDWSLWSLLQDNDWFWVWPRAIRACLRLSPLSLLATAKNGHYSVVKSRPQTYLNIVQY